MPCSNLFNELFHHVLPDHPFKIFQTGSATIKHVAMAQKMVAWTHQLSSTSGTNFPKKTTTIAKVPIYLLGLGSMAASFSSMLVARNQRWVVLLRTGVNLRRRSQPRKSRNKAMGSSEHRGWNKRCMDAASKNAILRTYIFIYLHIYIYIIIYMCVCPRVNTYIYIHTYTHIHTYI